MRKLRLDLNTLTVQSFTTAAASGTGTVRARESAEMGDTIFDNTCGQYPTCDQQCAPWTRQDGCETNGCTVGNSRDPYHTCEPNTCVYTGCNYTINMASCGKPDCSWPYACTQDTL